jgi:hypothetical protein
LFSSSLARDCVQISPIFGVRLFWSPSKCEGKVEVSNFLPWLSLHKNIADVIARGDQGRLSQYMKQMSSKLQFSWTPYCLKRENDGECAIKDAPCPHSSIFDCEIIRENSKELEHFTGFLIEYTSKFWCCVTRC